ncbi:hypothetical protein CTAYLR_007454 [Chrysophaeum taylorii]|uniref:Uncharacterized protein n=1 Tax=Chrysophaeum taylorii TaxID=2483200 RepID=A0AAD7XHH7_9STRA|nr:hypothetical protein CTAYLR_007454 [Chrysophaeum taylorii]
MPKDPIADPLVACCCCVGAVEAEFPECCAIDMEESCLCCEGKGRIAYKQPLLLGCVAKGQYCCCKIAEAFPCNKDLQIFETTLNLPFKLGAFGVFVPKDKGGGAAVTSENMSR